MEKISRTLIIFILLCPLGCFSQSLSIELKGNEGERILEISDTFASSLIKDTKVIRFIYLVTKDNCSQYYFGLISNRKILTESPPSYYFFNSLNELIVVYTGNERNIAFSETYLNEIKELSNKYLYPEDIIVSLHYYVWYLKFKNGKEVKFSTALSKKRQKAIPFWIM